MKPLKSADRKGRIEAIGCEIRPKLIKCKLERVIMQLINLVKGAALGDAPRIFMEETTLFERQYQCRWWWTEDSSDGRTEMNPLLEINPATCIVVVGPLVSRSCLSVVPDTLKLTYTSLIQAGFGDGSTGWTWAVRGTCPGRPGCSVQRIDYSLETSRRLWEMDYLKLCRIHCTVQVTFLLSAAAWAGAPAAAPTDPKAATKPPGFWL